jgi:tetratricopeptide (TPR) repeat protein
LKIAVPAFLFRTIRLAYRYKKKYNQAIADFEATLRINPEFALARQDLVHKVTGFVDRHELVRQLQEEQGDQ